MIDVPAFAAWLESSGRWRPSTSRSYARRVRQLTALAAASAAPSHVYPALAGCANAVLLFASDEEGGAVAPELAELCRAYSRRVARTRAQPRKRPARALQPADYERLLVAIEADVSLAARALEVIAETGLRTADTLRLRWSALDAAHRDPEGVVRLEQKGGTEREIGILGSSAWARLHAAWSERDPATSSNLALAIATNGNANPEADGTAYRAVHDTLRAIGARALPGERVHPHRLRRTVTIRALDAGADLREVAELLGHKDIRSTMRYADEQRPARVRETAARARAWKPQE